MKKMKISLRCPKCGDSITREFREGYLFSHTAFCEIGMTSPSSGCSGIVIFTERLIRNYQTFEKTHGRFLGDFS